MERATQDVYITHRSVHEKIIMHQSSWSYASSITQPSWRWSYQHGKSYKRWLHHTPIKTRKDYHESTFRIIRVKHNPTILALEFLTWKKLHKMVTSHTDQYTKRLSCTNLHDQTYQIKHNPNILAFELSAWKELRKMVTSHTNQNKKNYHASTFTIIRIKHNPTILAVELWAWKELQKMVTTQTDQYTKRLSWINLHDHTH